MSSFPHKRFFAALTVFLLLFNGFLVGGASAAEQAVMVGGQVFGDADRDGVASPGEALGGIRVLLGDGDGGRRSVTTDADGRYSFAEVPVGSYEVSLGNAPGEWSPPQPRSVSVDGAVSQVEVPFRLVHPLRDSLQAHFTLDKPVYPAGGAALMTVTLTNSGSSVISGIHGACDRTDSGRRIDIPEQNWGELGYEAAGATIQPGQTREFQVPGTVAPRAGKAGFVDQFCDFTASDEDLDGAPQDRHAAKVTGLDGTDHGTLFQDVNGNNRPDADEGIGGLTLRLTDLDSGHELTAATAADGSVEFAGPAGRYRVAPVGPWKFGDPGNDHLAHLVTESMEWGSCLWELEPTG